MSSAPREKKRAWGKTERKEITIINRENIEETLRNMSEEAKKCTVTSEESTRVMNLQYPELMSDEALVVALKRIKVPIPVYSDGRPSRERLLYLYKTNVLPRPQRSQWKDHKRKRSAGVTSQESTEMEVDHHGDWSIDGTTVLNRKRYFRLFVFLKDPITPFSWLENSLVKQQKTLLLLKDFPFSLRQSLKQLLLQPLVPPLPSAL